MAYTPQLTYQYSAILRRLAWAADLPMTKTIELILDSAVERTDTSFVCEKCRDRSRCSGCPFYHKKGDSADGNNSAFTVEAQRGVS